jgi:hypothetical protein
VPATASVQPTIAAVLGVVMLDEVVRGGWAVPVELALAAVTLFGVTLLARSPITTAEPPESDQPLPIIASQPP